PFHLAIDYQPRGDQGAAIDQLYRGVLDGEKHQVLLGVTGSGKTFTVAKIIEKAGRPALVLAHNKTLAAQLYQEFKTFFPSNAVEYFVSYYDYYQPEAYYGMLLMLEKGEKISRQQILSRLVDILYERNDNDFRRGTFRVRGDVIEVFPTYDDYAYRIELWGDEVDSLSQIDPVLGQVRQTYLRLPIYPKTHYVMTPETRQQALKSIEEELTWWHGELEKQGKLIEAQRLYQRTMFDLE